MKQNIQDLAVIFDLDGVIVNSNWAHEQAIREFCQLHGLTLSDEDLKTRIFGRRNKEWIPELLGRDLKLTDIERLSREKEAIFRRIFEFHVTPLAGLLPFLWKLKKGNIPVAVATSAPEENVSFLLGKLNLYSFFDVILDASDVRTGKPDPEIYLRAAERLGMSPERCVIFEDSLTGILAAKRAGSKVVGVTTTHGHAELGFSDFVIENFVNITLANLSNLFCRPG
jgi:beta-phosphoglucomutase